MNLQSPTGHPVHVSRYPLQLRAPTAPLKANVGWRVLDRAGQPLDIRTCEFEGNFFVREPSLQGCQQITDQLQDTALLPQAQYT